MLGATSIVTAQVPSSRPSSPIQFTPVQVAPDAAPVAARDPAAIPQPLIDSTNASAGRLSSTSDVADFLPPALGPAAQRQAYGQPDVQPDSRVKSVSKAPPVPRTTARVRGTATWFCVDGVSSCHYAKSGGMYAAAGAEIRVGDWRGRTVTVCAADDCVRVTLIDWCGCPGNRVIDLYGDAFRRLAPLGEGVIPITVRW